MGTSAWSLDVTTTALVGASCPSGSATVNGTGASAASSAMLASASGVIVGGLAACTVSTNVSIPVAAPSATVTVIVVVPDSPAAGVAVRVRFSLAPPTERLPSGTSTWLLEVAVTVSAPAALSMSATVNARGPIGTCWPVTWSAMSLIDGGSLTGSTVTVNVWVPMSPSASIA